MMALSATDKYLRRHRRRTELKERTASPPLDRNVLADKPSGVTGPLPSEVRRRRGLFFRGSIARTATQRAFVSHLNDALVGTLLAGVKRRKAREARVVRLALGGTEH